MTGIAREMEVCGLGLVTDACRDIGEFAQARSRKKNAEVDEPLKLALSRLRSPKDGTAQQQETLPQLALRASHQACSMANLLDGEGRLVAGAEVGMLFVTSWGVIDSTVEYLESMLAENGRFASPRHFARSVFSSVAAVTAIELGIHGPCETLCFPERPVTGALQSARRLLAAKRCEHVLVVWGEQAAEIAGHLSELAVARLNRKEFARFANQPLGYGAVALVLAFPGHNSTAPRIATLTSEAPANENATRDFGRPFPMDSAVELIEGILVKTEDSARVFK